MVYSCGAVQGTGLVSHGLGQGLGQGLCKGMQETGIGVGLAVTVVVLFLGSVLLGSMDTSNTENVHKYTDKNTLDSGYIKVNRIRD